MFVKAYKARGHTYLKLVKSIRKNGTPTHEIIANLGRTDRLQNGELDGIVKSLQKYITQPERSPHHKDISTMAETARVNYGYLAYRALWRLFGLEQALKTFCADQNIVYNYAATVFAMVANHALNPSSKRALHENREWYGGLCDDLQLQHLYRSLDLLAQHKSGLETLIFNKNRDLFNMRVDVVFFDVTTFYFESQQADALRDFGFGKDGKINEVQVVMALLIDADGRPITFELFPGNTFEGHTLLSTLDRLKARFQIRQVVIVADKGLNSKLNLKAIKDRGYDYIVSCRLKNLPKAIKEQALNTLGYVSISPQEVWVENDADAKNAAAGTDGSSEPPKKAHTFCYKVLDYTNIVTYKDEAKGETITIELAEKLVCTHSSKRAAKDAADRQRQVEKAEKAIAANQKSILSHRGYKRYIKTDAAEETQETLCLDQEKIDAEGRFDGYATLQCSRTDMDAVAVMRAYRQLLKIEESFRVMKTTLRTRPVFVWTPDHIRGHFVMCFLAFVLERELEYRLNKRGVENSPERIKTALKSMQWSELSIENERFYLKGKHDKLASEIFAILKMKQPVNLMNEEQCKDYLKRF